MVVTERDCGVCQLRAKAYETSDNMKQKLWHWSFLCQLQFEAEKSTDHVTVKIKIVSFTSVDMLRRKLIKTIRDCMCQKWYALRTFRVLLVYLEVWMSKKVKVFNNKIIVSNASLYVFRVTARVEFRPESLIVKHNMFIRPVR